jgi:hypothetical protein
MLDPVTFGNGATHLDVAGAFDHDQELGFTLRHPSQPLDPAFVWLDLADATLLRDHRTAVIDHQNRTT